MLKRVIASAALAACMLAASTTVAHAQLAAAGYCPDPNVRPSERVVDESTAAPSDMDTATPLDDPSQYQNNEQAAAGTEQYGGVTVTCGAGTMVVSGSNSGTVGIRKSC